MNTRRATQTSTERAASALRQMIISGALAPGSMHLETELADQLGLSRTPVREAALKLAAQGLIEVRPRKGVHILPISAVDLTEVYDVLTAIETLAAESAARRRLHADALAPLAQAVALMEAALDGDDLTAWAEADDQFHMNLVRLGGNSRAVSIAEMMNDQVRRARSITLRLRPKPLRSNEDHRAVLHAIQAGDAEGAAQVHRDHRRAARDLLLAILRSHGYANL